MMISGPWAWSNLIKRGIDFGVAPIPGVDENVGVLLSGLRLPISIAQARTKIWSRNLWSVTRLPKRGSSLYISKPIGVPALISVYEKMAKDNPLLRQLKTCVDYGQVMPNIPQMGRFFSSVGAALQIATNGRASAQAALSVEALKAEAISGEV